MGNIWVLGRTAGVARVRELRREPLGFPWRDFRSLKFMPSLPRPPTQLKRGRHNYNKTGLACLLQKRGWVMVACLGCSQGVRCNIQNDKSQLNRNSNSMRLLAGLMCVLNRTVHGRLTAKDMDAKGPARDGLPWGHSHYPGSLKANTRIVFLGGIPFLIPCRFRTRKTFFPPGAESRRRLQQDRGGPEPQNRPRLRGAAGVDGRTV